jgi:agmatine deiminase
MPTRREFIKQVSVAASVGAAVMGLGLSPARLLAAGQGR